MKNYLKIAVVALTLATGSAFAALPASVGTSMSEVQTDGLALIDLAWPVLTAITVGIVIMKLFKRAVSKAVYLIGGSPPFIFCMVPYLNLIIIRSCLVSFFFASSKHF